MSAATRSAIDVDALVAIDVHTHVLTSIHGSGHAYGTAEGSLADTFGGVTPLTLPEMADYYRERKMAAVVFIVDQMDEELPVSNDELLALAAEHRDVIIPFASVDPRRGAEGVARRRVGKGHRLRDRRGRGQSAREGRRGAVGARRARLGSLARPRRDPDGQ